MLVTIYLIPGFGKSLAARLCGAQQNHKILDYYEKIVSQALSSQLGKLGKFCRTLLGTSVIRLSFRFGS